MFQTIIWWRHANYFRFWLLVLCHFRITSSNQIWRKYLYPMRIYWHFPTSKIAAVVVIFKRAFCTLLASCRSAYQPWFKYYLQSPRSTHFCSRRSFGDVTRINFRFRFLVTVSLPIATMHLSTKFGADIVIHCMQSDLHFTKFKMAADGFVGQPRDHPH